MSLIVEVSIPLPNSVHTHSVGVLTIGRLRKLDESKPLDDQVHPYVAEIREGDSPTTVATLQHRYGDGAWVLISNALAALNHPENKEVR